MGKERGQKQNIQLTGRAAEFGDCVEIPCGLRGEDIPTIPGEIYQTVPEVHTSVRQRIEVHPEMVITELRV